MRAPFQVLVLPYRHTADGPRYCILRRSDAGYWQFVAGGGEQGESPEEAAARELREETGKTGPLLRLTAMTWFPAKDVRPDWATLWGERTLVVPEYMFAVRLDGGAVSLSYEHTAYQWVPYDAAQALLHWEGDQTALYELDNRIRLGWLN